MAEHLAHQPAHAGGFQPSILPIPGTSVKKIPCSALLASA
jgi:hypothetical protein